jgi:type VI secretion system protein ImpE
MSVAAAEEAFRTGDPAGALILLQAQVRLRPQDPKLRIFLAQLLMVLGQWERAQNQLDVIRELDASALPMVHTYRTAMQCEQLRTQVFAGRRSPLIFGEPEPWIAMLIHALSLDQAAQAAEAATLRAQAFEQAAACGGAVNGAPFEWIADADSRLGPMMEVLLNGAYYWVPVGRIARLTIEPPADMRDFVWLPATFVWANGGEAMGLIPTRYPLEQTTDPQLLMARRTDWIELGADQYAGLGQRLLTTDAAEYGLLDVRELVITPPAAT